MMKKTFIVKVSTLLSIVLVKLAYYHRLLALVKSFGNYTRMMLVSQNKDRTGRIKTKQGIPPFGTAVFYISDHPGLNLY